MKELIADGDEDFLFLMGGGFKFYCLQLKILVGIPKILVFFQVGMEVQCNFPMGMKFQGILSAGDDFSPDFSSGEGVPPGLWHGCRNSSFRFALP